MHTKKLTQDQKRFKKFLKDNGCFGLFKKALYADRKFTFTQWCNDQLLYNLPLDKMIFIGGAFDWSKQWPFFKFWSNLDRTYRFSLCPFKIGDKVIYKDVLGEITNISLRCDQKEFLLSLEAVDNPEMSCTAEASFCELWNGEKFDSSDALYLAELDSALTMYQIAGITDAHIGDGVIKY